LNVASNATSGAASYARPIAIWLLELEVGADRRPVGEGHRHPVARARRLGGLPVLDELVVGIPQHGPAGGGEVDRIVRRNAITLFDLPETLPSRPVPGGTA